MAFPLTFSRSPRGGSFAWLRWEFKTAPCGRDANGVVRNEDGTVNDEDHPAARGSTVTLYATGLGLTTGSGDPGSIATTDKITPAATFYAWWSSSSTSTPAP